MESNKSTEKSIVEKMREKVSGSLEAAKNNPIAESRLVELEKQLSFFKDEFIKSGTRNAESTAQEDEIEAEILRSSALADTLPEYKEMLQQIGNTYGLSKEWKEDLLAHENSHASVALATGHEWVGYAAVFIKDDSGNLSNIQPLHFTKPNLSWGPKELISKSVEVTEAPEVYGNKLSEGDEISLAEDRARLEKIKLNEEQDRKKIEELKGQLGIL